MRTDRLRLLDAIEQIELISRQPVGIFPYSFEAKKLGNTRAVPKLIKLMGNPQRSKTDSNFEDQVTRTLLYPRESALLSIHPLCVGPKFSQVPERDQAIA